MTATAKEFQAATVRAATAALRREGGTRRFLIADEVGLGKTLVARDVIAGLAARRRKPLVVFYVTSGSKVGDQNKRDLLTFLPEAERAGALSSADRVGLIPFTRPPEGRVHLHAFSPETSFPAAGARSSPGRAVERAFVSKLLKACLPDVHRALRTDYFQLSATKSWPDALKSAKRAMRSGVGTLPHAFRRALEAEFAPLSVRDGILAGKDRRHATIARLRRALAEASLAATPPDLVILDEFQCYRRLLAPAAEDRIAARLLGRAGAANRRPAALLLSATPYRTYAERWEAGTQARPHRELFDVVEFLGGEEAKKSASQAFERFGSLLQSLGRLGAGEDHGDLIERARSAKEEVEGLLRPLMSRTERVVRDDGAVARDPGRVALLGTDLDAYRHFASGVDERHRSSAMTYWLSVPLPAQALGQAYQISRGRRFGSPPGAPRISPMRLYAPPKDGWGSAKLRRLHDIADPDALALPWVPPSIPWWTPAGSWARDHPGKVLIFSRFRATPTSIASLTSLEVERRLLGRSAESYRKAWRQRRLQPKRGQAATVALFHPSPFLIGSVDVLRGSDARTPGRVRAATRRQLEGALRKLKVGVGAPSAKDAKRHRPGWEITAALDRAAGHADAVATAWRPLAARDAALAHLVGERSRARTLTWVSPAEMDDLVEAAAFGPAVALGRALRRHYPQALGPGLPALTRLCWKGLRTYLDNPLFWAGLGSGTPTDALQRAVREGGFEAVMDEHFWTRSAKKGPAGLADDLLEAFDAQVGWSTFRGLQDQKVGIRVRCHAAVPFGGTEKARDDDPAGERPHRSEGIRAAFNTPFWPHVLATTSVGQEGLDFHTWCDRIGHWDLCSSPVDLEQREGRIQRFGGLVVRRRLGEELGDVGRAAGRRGGSPWTAVAAEAECRFADDTGLSPWWTLPGAEVKRHLFTLPQSRDVHRYAKLCRQRSIYRLALGQPRQEELVEMLGAKDPAIVEQLASLTLDLSAYTAERSLA